MLGIVRVVSSRDGYARQGWGWLGYAMLELARLRYYRSGQSRLGYGSVD
jgi:hypothetical protein